jgi:hypothetical protein
MQILVKQARTRNELLGITGALAFTGDHFAQLLEGESSSIDDVMGSISRDSRHHSIRSFQDAPTRRRIFPQWSLAFSGRSTYVDRHIRPLFAVHHDDLSGARAELLDLMQSLTYSADL